MTALANKWGSVVYQQYASAEILTATTTLIKTGPGLFHALVINTNVDAKAITIYDALTATGTPLATILTSGTLPFRLEYNIGFSVGLFIVTSGATKTTVLYR